MKDDDRDVLAIGIAGVLGFVCVSLLAGGLLRGMQSSMAEGLASSGPSLGGAIVALLQIPVFLIALPGMVVTYIIPSSVVFLAFIASLVFYFRKQLFEGVTEAASYTVQHPSPEPSPEDIKKKAEHVHRETKRKDSHATLEDAIREMQEAQSRYDEFNKKDQS